MDGRGSLLIYLFIFVVTEEKKQEELPIIIIENSCVVFVASALMTRQRKATSKYHRKEVQCVVCLFGAQSCVANTADIDCWLLVVVVVALLFQRLSTANGDAEISLSKRAQRDYSRYCIGH